MMELQLVVQQNVHAESPQHALIVGVQHLYVRSLLLALENQQEEKHMRKHFAREGALSSLVPLEAKMGRYCIVETGQQVYNVVLPAALLE